MSDHRSCVPQRVDRVENATVSSEWNVAGVEIRVDNTSTAVVVVVLSLAVFAVSDTLDLRWGILYRELYYSRNFLPSSAPFFYCVSSGNGSKGPDPEIQHLVFLFSPPNPASFVCIILFYFFYYYYRKSPLFSSRTQWWFQFSHIIRKASRQVFR